MLAPGARLNGRNHLTSHVADEGFSFVPRNMTSLASLHSWVRLMFPRFDDALVERVLGHYPYQSLDNTDARFATAKGYQQIANKIYAEATFICPSYWLAEAHNGKGKKGWKMQYSIPIALHGYDAIALFGNNLQPVQGEEFVAGLQRIVGDFIRTGTPGDVEEWTPFKSPNWDMLNLNQTGGVEVDVNSALDLGLNGMGLKWMIGPGLKKEFVVENGCGWDGGRGERCAFWKAVAGQVPM